MDTKTTTTIKLNTGDLAVDEFTILLPNNHTITLDEDGFLLAFGDDYLDVQYRKDDDGHFRTRKWFGGGA